MSVSIQARLLFRVLPMALVSCAICLASPPSAAATNLSDQPITSSTTANAKPNILFVLDDSGSMSGDFLPDWAGPFQSTLAGVPTIITPAYRFFNSSFNGIAYNPATRYQSPVMYSSTGALDTTTYPSQAGHSAASGGDASASAVSRNWRAVRVDGYSIQSKATVNLEAATASFVPLATQYCDSAALTNCISATTPTGGFTFPARFEANAFSFTTVAGEYCDSAQLRNCTAATAPTGTYTFPAKLRWCRTDAKTIDTTAGAGTDCQVSNIDDTAANRANGVTTYPFARMARPPLATITVGAALAVNGIRVDGLEILPSTASGGSSTDVASAIAAKINACTFVSTGNCTVVGFRATSALDAVTVTAPFATTASPSVSGGTTSVSAFSVGNVPGVTLMQVIRDRSASYAYPGSSAKHPSRTDCVGTTCTYSEEMTNYANWFAYYRTRMQAMKTSASIAFSGVDQNFRVGYYSLNNGGGNQFINPSDFDGPQKNLWYSRFFSAVPFGATPLRSGLATAGRFYAYAGDMTTLNGVTTTDPMQYACQKNFTILSTDGYWNDDSEPTRIGGTTLIGQQDGADYRPYWDGEGHDRTVTQTMKSELQIGMNSHLVERRLQQQHETRTRLIEALDRTTTYPFAERTTTLQTQTTPLGQLDYALERRVYPLTSTTREVEESVFMLESTPKVVQKFSNKAEKTVTPLESTTYKLTETTQLLTRRDYNVSVSTELLTASTYRLVEAKRSVNREVYNLTKSTQLLTSATYKVSVETYPLQSVTTKLRSSTRQLQKRLQTRDPEDGGDGDSWVDTDWVNVSVCEERAAGPGMRRLTRCRYDTAVDQSGLDSCATVAPSVGPHFTVAQAVTCDYDLPPVVDSPSSCTVTAPSSSSPYLAAVGCRYAAVPSVAAGQTSCSAHDETGLATMSGSKVVCNYDAAPSATSSNLPSCTHVIPSTAASAPQTLCSYQTATAQSGLTICAAVSPSTVATDTAVWLAAVSCSYDASPTTSSPAPTGCVFAVPTPAASAPMTACSYSAPTITGNLGSCAAIAPATATTDGAIWNATVACAYETIPATTPNLTSCTYRTPAIAASAPKTECSYQAASVTPGQSACTAVARQSGTVDGVVYGSAVSCAYDPTPAATTANLSSCIVGAPATAASAPRADCSYEAATTVSGRSSCAAAAPGSATTDGAVWSTAVTCAYDAIPTVLQNQASCTWATADLAANPALPATSCAYNAALASTTAPGTCTPSGSPTGTATGTVWTGPLVECNMGLPALIDPSAMTCTADTPPSGTSLSDYTSCSYADGPTTRGLNSCIVVPMSTGPVFTPGNSCAYSASAASVTAVPSCTPVGQSPTFAAPQKTCAYEVIGTPATNLPTCVEARQSTSAPYVGPSVSCAYSSTASVTNLNATTCNASRSLASPFSGPAEDCNYSSTWTSALVPSCLEVPQSSGPAFVGPASACVYGPVSGFVDASGSCTEVPQSAGPAFLPARECRYSAPTTTMVAACAPDVPESTGPTYTTLRSSLCLPGPFSDTAPTVTTTVDSCTTSSSTSGSPVIVSTTTSCAYDASLPPTSVATCTPHAADSTSPFASQVVCSVSDTGYARTGSACTPTSPPGVFDASGTQIECRVTDTTPYNSDYPSGPVAVATCTPTTDPTTLERTTCTNLLSTGPAPVESTRCASSSAAAPDFISTTCTTQSTTSTVSGCSDETPSAANGWKTVTCLADGTGTQNTLADVAAYYYKTDLRTPTLGNCAGAVVPPGTSTSVLCTATDEINIVQTSPNDPNPAQHMVTFTLGLGASGYMQYTNNYQTATPGDYATVAGPNPFNSFAGYAADPANGVCSWQAAGGECNWPRPAGEEQTTIDDLWHAAVNGHGTFYSAGDPASLAGGMTSALNGVNATGGRSAATSLSTPNLTSNDNYVFSSSYVSLDWTGDVARRRIDPFSGRLAPAIDWSAQAKLDARTSPRTIYTFDASVATTKLKPFTSTNFGGEPEFNTPHISTGVDGLSQFLCVSPDTCLTAADQASAEGAKLVDFLRGDTTHEEGTTADNSKYFRHRQHVLGDIVNSQTVYVGKVTRDYGDPGYAAFRNAQAGRKAVVYVGANDGMLHAFQAKGDLATERLVDAAASANAASAGNPANTSLQALAAAAEADAAAALARDPGIGQELWAYIPSVVRPNLYRLADKKYRDKHRYLVDATPVVGDVCKSACSSTSAAWRTILVGGVGHGGRGYYALDITDPDNPNALWEFTAAQGDVNLGYSYGNPQISKLANGTWVVAFTTGYNNVPNEHGNGGDGVGRLYVVDAYTGVPVTGLSPISTGHGSSTSPSGLAQISGIVTDPLTDNTLLAVYGGDLDGNLWRFDVNGTVGPTGTEAQLLAVLKDASGRTQPITAKPTVTFIKNQKVIYVGTGRFLDSSDSLDANQQTLYAIKDPWTPGGTAATPIFDNPGGDRSVAGKNSEGFVKQVHSWTPCPANTTTGICINNEPVIVSTNNPVDFVLDKGWFVDLSNPSERANTAGALGLGLLVYATNAPSTFACDLGGKSYLYFLNYLTGGGLFGHGNSGGVVGYLLANAFASAPSIVVKATPDGGAGLPVIVVGIEDPAQLAAPWRKPTTGGGYFKESQDGRSNCDGLGNCVLDTPVATDTLNARRTAWRELIDQ